MSSAVGLKARIRAMLYFSGSSCREETAVVKVPSHSQVSARNLGSSRKREPESWNTVPERPCSGESLVGANFGPTRNHLDTPPSNALRLCAPNEQAQCIGRPKNRKPQELGSHKSRFWVCHYLGALLLCHGAGTRSALIWTIRVLAPTLAHEAIAEAIWPTLANGCPEPKP